MFYVAPAGSSRERQSVNEARVSPRSHTNAQLQRAEEDNGEHWRWRCGHELRDQKRKPRCRAAFTS
jgi:hypothetical protein